MFSQWDCTKRELHACSRKYRTGKSRGWDGTGTRTLGQVVFVLERWLFISQIKIVTGVALALDFKIASYFG